MVFAELVRRFDLQTAHQTCLVSELVRRSVRQDDVRDLSRTNPFRAADTELVRCVHIEVQAVLTCSLLISFVFYMEWSFAWIVWIGFFNEEYRIAIVDFIPPRGGA